MWGVTRSVPTPNCETDDMAVIDEYFRPVRTDSIGLWVMPVTFPRAAPRIRDIGHIHL